MELYFAESGPADAPTILFVHGGGGAGWNWAPQVEALTSHYHCLVPDLPEQGRSLAVGPFTMADTTARLIKKAVTDAERFITYEPDRRPEVANLLLLAGLATDREPAEIAEEIGNGGGGGLKNFVTEAINAYFAPIRARRAELVADPGHLLDVLRAGNARANEIADATLDEVRTAMGMKY